MDEVDNDTVQSISYRLHSATRKYSEVSTLLSSKSLASPTATSPVDRRQSNDQCRGDIGVGRSESIAQLNSPGGSFPLLPPPRLVPTEQSSSLPSDFLLRVCSILAAPVTNCPVVLFVIPLWAQLNSPAPFFSPTTPSFFRWIPLPCVVSSSESVLAVETLWTNPWGTVAKDHSMN